MMRTTRLFLATSLTALHAPCSAFHAPPSRHVARPASTLPHKSVRTALRLFGDDDSAIPPELRSEIYEAEAKTVAAQNRPRRIVAYSVLTFLGVSIAFFNAFLTSLRFSEGAPSSDLDYYGFGWVEHNFLWGFFFTNKIGGALGLLGAGLSGTLAEIEIRSKKENAEKIWAELQRRKAARESNAGGSAKKSKNKGGVPPSSKRSMTGRQKKRLSALEELMEESNTGSVDDESADKDSTQTSPVLVDTPYESSLPQIQDSDTSKKEDKSILSTLKSFYEKADSMAASQALLLNKELEDRGIIEKITDETGLKVIGKEAAAAAEKSRNKMEEKRDD